MLDILGKTHSGAEKAKYVVEFKGIPLGVLGKFRPELAKIYIEHKIKTEGIHPKELLENEQGMLEREFLEEFLREQGYLEKVEKKAEEIREKVEEVKKAVEERKVEVRPEVKAEARPEAGVRLDEIMEKYPNIALLVAKLKKKGVNVDVETLVRDLEDVRRLEEWVDFQGVHKNEDVLEALKNSGLPPEVVAKVIRGMARRNASPQDIKNALELLTHLHREHGEKLGPVFQSSRALESMVDLLKTGDLEKVVEDIKRHQGVDIRNILNEDDVFASKLHEILLKNYSVPVPEGWADVLRKLAKGQLSREEAARILALHTILKHHYSTIEQLESELEEAKKMGKNPEAVLRQKIDQIKKELLYGKNMPERLKLAMQVLGKDKIVEVLKEVHEKEIQPFIENRREVLRTDPKRITFDASRNAQAFEHMEHTMELLEKIARGADGDIQKEAYERLAKRLVPLSFGGNYRVEPFGITVGHQAILEWVEREFLGRKAVESRKRRYMPGHR